MLLGAQLTDEDGTKVDMAESRIKAVCCLPRLAMAVLISARLRLSIIHSSGTPALPR
jgi:hypothetical protein